MSSGIDCDPHKTSKVIDSKALVAGAPHLTFVFELEKAAEEHDTVAFVDNYLLLNDGVPCSDKL